MGLAGAAGVIAAPAVVRSAELQKVRLGWAQPAACHAPLAFAAKQGIEIELVDFLANGDDALTKDIASGSIYSGSGTTRPDCSGLALFSPPSLRC